MFEMVFTRRFSMGHRLIHDTNDVCSTPHGHNEEVIVYLIDENAQVLDGSHNMVLPFSKAKTAWHRFIDGSVDHAFQLSEDDPLLDWFKVNEPQRISHLMITPGDPTTELLACLFMSKVNAILKDEQTTLRCHRIEIKETPTNTVCFAGNPFDFLPKGNNAQQRWWERPDMSISDVCL